MSLITISHKKNVVCEARYVGSIIGKARGLMLRKKCIPLLFDNHKEQRVSLHMWFVLFPIDVLYIDGNGVVVDTVENFIPFSMYFARKKSRYILEVPEGTVKEHGVKVGSKVGLEGLP